jgi:hypothetical protein
VKRELCEFRWLHIPYQAAAELLRERGLELIGPAAEAGAHHASALLALDAEIAGRHVERQVELELGKPDEATGAFPILRLPIKWHAQEHSGLFPVMDGQLEAYPIDGERTQVSFQGSYQPPFGLVGEALDAMLLHRVAEESVQRFLRAVAQRLRHAWLGHRGEDHESQTAPRMQDGPAAAGPSG